MHRSPFGVEVSRRPLLPVFAAAPLAVVVPCRALGARLLPAGARVGALPGAVERASLVGTSGSGKRRFVRPDLMRRSIEGRTEGPESAFLWISKTVSFGAYKRNGFWRIRPQRRSLWIMAQGRQPLEPTSVTLRVTAPPPGGSHVLKDAVLETGQGPQPLTKHMPLRERIRGRPQPPCT